MPTLNSDHTSLMIPLTCSHTCACMTSGERGSSSAACPPIKTNSSTATLASSSAAVLFFALVCNKPNVRTHYGTVQGAHRNPRCNVPNPPKAPGRHVVALDLLGHTRYHHDASPPTGNPRLKQAPLCLLLKHRVKVKATPGGVIYSTLTASAPHIAAALLKSQFAFIIP